MHAGLIQVVLQLEYAQISVPSQTWTVDSSHRHGKLHGKLYSKKNLLTCKGSSLVLKYFIYPSRLFLGTHT